MPAEPLNWGDFQTYRGQVNYSMTDVVQEKFPTRGEQLAAYNVARVPWSRKDAFLDAILPDVELGAQTGANLNIGSYGTSDKVYPRVRLNRKIPQQHPIYRNMYVVDAQVLGGDGAPMRDGDLRSLVFNERADPDADETFQTGYAKIGLTWSTLPYYPYLYDKTLGGVTTPDEDATNDICNLDEYNELARYCKIKVINKGQNLQIKGRVFYFVNDDGSIMRVNDTANGVPLAVPETNQAIYVPSLLYSVTMYMVPAVPFAQYTLLNHVNQTDDQIWFPQVYIPIQPEVGTLLYLGFEISDPYWTYAGNQVFDITTALLYRPGGEYYYRGHNATWCGQRQAFRRVVGGQITNNNIVDSAGNPLTLPRHDTATATDRLVATEPDGTNHNIHPFGELANLWRFEDTNVEEEPWINEPIRLHPIFRPS